MKRPVYCSIRIICGMMLCKDRNTISLLAEAARHDRSIFFYSILTFTENHSWYINGMVLSKLSHSIQCLLWKRKVALRVSPVFLKQRDRELIWITGTFLQKILTKIFSGKICW
jgi:hypothetical protein